MFWNINQNPYNFVRFSERIVEKDANGEPLELPDHSVFSGNSGYIKCELTNETPLFSRGEEKEEGSQKYDFLRINKNLAILSTSIKGMIRSLVETLTGSCLSNFDEGRLDFRKPTSWAGQETWAGIVTRLPGKNGVPGEIQELEIAWVQTYRDDYTFPKISLSGFKHGQSVYVKTKGPIPYTNSRGILIPDIYCATNIRPATGSPAPDEKEGYLKLTGRTINNKKRERVFFHNGVGMIEFEYKEKEDYDYILAQQLDRKKRGHPFNTRFQHEKLSVGDLVYFQKEKSKAVKLSNVAVPRLRYAKGIGDRLDRSAKCSKSNPCLACRLFGFVDDKDSLSGRVSFSHAVMKNGESPEFGKISLRPLGSPNPTSCNLYLETQDGTVRDYDGYQITDSKGNKRENQDDNANIFLRGRKYYWHRRGNEIEQIITKATAPSNANPQMLQNIEVLTSQTAFHFKAHFHNLTDFELGLLLYALKLEGNMRHKLGMAKNLGFGTVKIDVQNLSIDNMTEKYSSLDLNYRKEKTPEEIDKYIKGFQTKIANFDNLVAVQDLRRILDPTRAPENLGYPEESDGKNYRWYMENKNEPLPLLLEQGKGRKSV